MRKGVLFGVVIIVLILVFVGLRMTGNVIVGSDDYIARLPSWDYR